jgi:F-type H+-transporting ATPase subunit b
MPQLSQLALVYQSQWFWLLLVLATIYFVVGRGIVSKVESTVDARDKQIAIDLAVAEQLQAEAAQAEEVWREQMNSAHAKGQAEAAQAKANATREAELRIAKADKEIAAKTEKAARALADARTSAMAELERIAAEAASEIVGKLTGAKVTDKAATAAVSGALNRAGASNRA